MWVSPKNLQAAEAERVFGKALEHEYSLADLLRRPGVTYESLMTLEGGRYASRETAENHQEIPMPSEVADQVEISLKYSGYIDRQRSEVLRAAKYEHLKLPDDLDYLQVTALSFEARQTLVQRKPETLGLASRISGITPASISLLLVYLKKRGYLQFADDMSV